MRVTDPRNKAVIDLADHLSGHPESTFWSKWFGGCVLPAILAAIGTECCITRYAVLGGSGGTMDLTGGLAIAMGVAWLSAASFLHFHYFWSAIRRVDVFSYPGKLFSAIMLVASFGYVLWSIIMG